VSEPDLPQRLGLLRSWMLRHPGATPTRSTEVPCGDGVFALGVWVMNLRADFRLDRMDPELICALESIPGWSWDGRQALFGGRSAPGYLALVDHVRRYGHARPDPGSAAGRFVAARRYDHRAGRLQREQIEALLALPGFTFTPESEAIEPPRRIPWILYRRVLELLADHGRVDLELVSEHLDSISAGWVLALVRDREAGRADESLVQLFSALPGWSWPQDAPEGP